MSHNNSGFREELPWNSYFVEGIYHRVHEEVEFAAEQYEEDTGKEVTEQIDEITEEILTTGLSSITNSAED